jgi:hypothetical protein
MHAQFEPPNHFQNTKTMLFFGLFCKYSWRPTEGAPHGQCPRGQSSFFGGDYFGNGLTCLWGARGAYCGVGGHPHCQWVLVDDCLFSAHSSIDLSACTAHLVQRRLSFLHRETCDERRRQSI